MTTEPAAGSTSSAAGRPGGRHPDSPPGKVHEHRPRRVGELVENLFFVVAMLLVLAFAVVLLRQADSAWTLIPYVLVFWAVMAYLALPRLHRILTAIYVPTYFMGRSLTSDGLLGDPINLALNGTREQIDTAMQAAGWALADPVTLGSSWRIVVSSVLRRSYPQAPVSPLLLFGRVQDFAYQQQVEGNPSQRHHVRFWRCPDGWPLPGGHRVGWLAAGTYDRAVGLSLFTLQVTHKIDADIDVERDHVVDTVRGAVPSAQVRVLEDFTTSYHSRNGGGDAVRTDGNLPVLELGRVPVAAAAVASDPAAGGLVTDGGTATWGDVGRRPFSVVAAWGLTLVSALLSVIDAAARPGELVDVLDLSTSGAAAGAGAAVLALLVVYGAVLWLGWRTYRGGRVARLTTIVLITAAQVIQMRQFFTGGHPSTGSLLSSSVDLLTIYALTSLSAREWTRSQHPTGAPAAREIRPHRGR